MVAKGYRPDIDGLRAVAVLAVLFYHVGFGWFPGGYVGVDVFFVISGFLITRLIRDEIATGTFRFSTFYIRRARRLFPAMFVTLAATFLAGTALFGPEDLERLGRAVVSAVLSVSNVLFWLESGYFDAAAETKPLLHTWSLAVEEQFYFLWPVTLVALMAWSRRVAARSETYAGWIVPGVLVLAGVASLVATQIVLEIDQAAAFYLVPFRISEFAIGALMVWLVVYRPQRAIVSDLLIVAGLALIVWPVLTYSSETVFPGLAALPPCVGTALLILAGPARRTGLILNNRVAVGIGLISYSLYLVHWPIIVFVRSWLVRPLDPVEQAVIVVVSIAIAAAMYRFVEQPFRRVAGRSGALSPRGFVRLCLILAALLVLPAALAWQGNGWAWRLPADLRAAVSDLEAKRAASWDPVRPLMNRKAFRGKGAKILVIGDSNAKDFINALRAASTTTGTPLDIIFVNVSYHCQPYAGDRTPNSKLSKRLIRDCNKNMRGVLTGDLIKKADAIVFSPRWTPRGVDNIAEVVERIRRRTDTPVVLMGRTVEFESVPGLLVRSGSFDGIDAVAARNTTDLSEINNRLKRIAGETGALYLSKQPLICPAPDRCDVVDGNKRLLIYDYGHWTLEGAAFYGNRLVETGMFDEIVKPKAD